MIPPQTGWVAQWQSVPHGVRSPVWPFLSLPTDLGAAWDDINTVTNLLGTKGD